MDLSTALNISGGIILGFALVIIAVIIYFASIIIKKKSNTFEKKSSFNKPTVITALIGALVVGISLIAMVVTSSYSEVGTIFYTLSSTEDAIYKDTHYVKTDFVLNGQSGKYKYKDIEDSILTGVPKLYELSNYNSYNIIVTQDTNITGSIFVAENEKKDFEDYYSNYQNYDTGIVFDKHNKKLESVEKDCSQELYAKLSNMDNYTETDEDNVPYSDELGKTKNYIFWANSKDKLISSQVKLYPKDKQDYFVMTDGKKFYHLNDELQKEVENIVKDMK